MSRSKYGLGADLLRDALCAPYLPAEKSAGWKRDQHLRRTGPIRHEFSRDPNGSVLSLPHFMTYVQR